MGKFHSGPRGDVSSARMYANRDENPDERGFEATSGAEYPAARCEMSSVEGAAPVHRQLAKGALSGSEEPFRLIVDSIPAFAWYASPDGKIEYLNQRILDYTGEHLEDLVGFGWANVLHPQDVERTKKAWLHSIETGEPCDVDQRVRRFDNV